MLDIGGSEDVMVVVVVRIGISSREEEARSGSIQKI